MSTADLKRAAESLSLEDRVFMAAYLKHLGRVDDRAYQDELTRLNAEIDAGRKLSLEQVRRLHKALEDEGM